MTTKPEEILQYARDAMDSSGGAGPALWARCSALLTRQALETALDDFWQQQAPDVEHASRHSQLLCLGSYLGDDQLAARVAHAWSSLSDACHYHSYGLAPTAGQLTGWIETVDEFATCCRGASNTTQTPGLMIGDGLGDRSAEAGTKRSNHDDGPIST